MGKLPALLGGQQLLRQRRPGGAGRQPAGRATCARSRRWSAAAWSTRPPARCRPARWTAPAGRALGALVIDNLQDPVARAYEDAFFAADGLLDHPPVELARERIAAVRPAVQKIFRT